MKKYFAKSLIIALGFLTISSQSVFVSTSIKEKSIENPPSITAEEQEDLFKKFPDFENSIEENTTGKLIYRKNIYIKYAPISSNLKKEYNSQKDVEKDFIITEHTKEEYEQEILKESLNSKAIGRLEQISNSWLNMDLQVYNRNSSSTFMAYNFSSWIKNPVFSLEDAIGIFVGEGMYIPGANDSSLRQAQYSYYDGYDPNNWNTRNLQTQIKNDGMGTIAKFKLDSYMGAYEFHNIMIQSPVNFHPHTNEGWISGHYLQKGKNISSINVDINVVPNLSISDASD